MRRSSRLLLSSLGALALQCCACAAFAARVDNLFFTEVAVGDTSVEARESALGLALGEVLVRITGARDAAENPELAAIIENAPRFVQVYSYGRTARGQVLSVNFDGEALQDSVASAGIPVWGTERPKVLVWLAIDYGGGQRLLLSEDNEGAVADLIRQAALARGLPMSLPLMDAEDRERIRFADVWGGFTQAVERASQRYQPDAILVGRARRKQGGRLGAEWKLYFASAVLVSEGGLDAGINEAADYFARQFVVGGQSVQARQSRLQVTGIDSLEVYARVLDFLEALSVVEQVRLAEVSEADFVFELGLKGSTEQLRRAIALAGVLQEIDTSADAVPDQILRYRPRP